MQRPWIAGLLLLWATPSPAATLRVPEDHATIQQAIDAAMAGDVVDVGPGTWGDAENRTVWNGGMNIDMRSVAFLKPDVVVRSRAGAGATTIDGSLDPGPGFQSPVCYAGPQNGPATIEGFTIIGVGIGSSGVATLAAQTTIIRNCVIRDIDTGGRAITCSNGAAAEVYDTLIEDLENVDVYGSIRVVEATSFTMIRTTIRDIDGRGLFVDTTPVTIEDCAFIRNRYATSGGAVNIHAPAVIRGTLFLENVSTEGSAGAVIIFDHQAIIEHCTFVRDSCAAAGATGGLVLWDTAGVSIVRNNTFIGCHSPLFDGSAFAAARSAAEFSGNIVAKNTGAAAVYSHDGTITGGCNDYWNNEGGDFGTWDPQPTDFAADPLFCDPDVDDFHVQSNSLCAPDQNPGCGQVGAWPVGCGAVSVEPMSWGRLKEAYR